jgi:GNAT superfamily N-acetyltransferase
MKIRAANASDAAALAGLLEQLGYPCSTDVMSRRLGAVLAREDHATWVAEETGVVSGMIAACLALSFERGVFGRIIALVVDADARGHGIGSSLLAEAERWTVARGARHVAINSATHREEARAFYERRGYAVTGWRFAKAMGG